jgi:membrane-associated phospholipid phosphatase
VAIRKPLCSLVAAALTLTLAAAAFAQQPPASPARQDPKLRTFFQDLAHDVRELGSDGAGVSLATAGILSTAFHPLDDDIAKWKEADGFKSGTWIGNGALLAAGSLGIYSVAHWTHESRVEHVAVDLLRAQVLSLGLTYGVKTAVPRERPDQSSDDSFPSGHTAEMFASATVLARHLGPKVGWPAYGLAAFVGISRMNQGRHFLSDVIFGAGIGVAVGWNTSHRGAAIAKAWTVSPGVSRSGMAVYVARRFTP